MSWPPYLLKVKINNGRHDFGLWIPLFLLVPVVLVCVLAVLLIMLPFVLIALLLYMLMLIADWRIDRMRNSKRYLRRFRWVVMSTPAIIGVLWSLSGLKIQVGSRDQVSLIFY